MVDSNDCKEILNKHIVMLKEFEMNWVLKELFQDVQILTMHN